jgi:hypothetical protein
MSLADQMLADRISDAIDDLNKLANEKWGQSGFFRMPKRSRACARPRASAGRSVTPVLGQDRASLHAPLQAAQAWAETAGPGPCE